MDWEGRGQESWPVLSNLERFRRTMKRRKMAVFWVVAPSSLIEVCRRFRGACYTAQQPRKQPSSYSLP
jgi:hypothetical protein